MKTVRVLFLLFLCSASLHMQAAQKITLSEAVKNKFVTAKITGLGYTETSSSHFGECMKFELTNKTVNILDIIVETGRMLNPYVDSVQSMILTKEMIVSLQPKAIKSFFAYAMCTEKPDLPPAPNRKYKLGSVTTGKLLLLSKLIEKYNYQDYTGQNAVWVLTNNLPISYVTSSDAEKERILRTFLTQDQTVLSENTNTYYSESKTASIQGKFSWTMDKAAIVSVVVLNEQGNEIGIIMKNIKYEKGKQTYSFRFTGCLIEPDKTYKVRLKVQEYTIDELTCLSETEK